MINSGIFAGIDIGSRTTKACLMENGSFLSYGITKTTPDIPKTAYAVLSEALRKKDLSMEEIVYPEFINLAPNIP